MKKSLLLGSLVLIFLMSFVLHEGDKELQDSMTPYAKHVLLIGSDGFGAYAFKKAKVPNLRMMMKEGSYSLHARSVLPSSSAVNWASMIMGSGPELHGYTTWGSKTPEVPSRVIGEGGIYPTIISLLDEQRPEAKKGVVYTWGGIRYLFERSMVDIDVNGRSDEETLETALDFMVDEKAAFTFIHFNEPDGAGHDIGHDTPEYYAAAEKIDSLVGVALERLKKEGMLDDTVILFSSDHGGIDKGHGGTTLLEVEIPWIIYGKNIASHGALEKSIVTYDTAATLALILGLEQPDFWRGVPVKEVLAK